MCKLCKRFMVSLALLVVVSSVLAACGGSSTLAPNNTGATSNSGGGGAGSTANDEVRLLEQAASDMKALKSYHVDITTIFDGHTTKNKFDVDVAGNKLKMNTNNAGEDLSFIYIGNHDYMSTDGGKTYIQSAAGQLTQTLNFFTHMWDNYTATNAATMTNALKEGNPFNEQIDGTDTKHLTADIAALGGVDGVTRGTVDLWISTNNDPTIRQKKVVSSPAVGHTSIATLKWSKFNEDLGIQAPNVSGGGSVSGDNLTVLTSTTDIRGSGQSIKSLATTK